MTSKLPIASLLILAACSGASAGPIPDSLEPANTFVTRAPDPPTPVAAKAVVEDSGSTAEASTDAGQDSGQDATADASEPDSGGPDASVDATVEASVDAGVDAADAAVTPRFGVTFDGSGGAYLLSPLSTDIIGKSTLTFETYFRLNAVTDRGLIFRAPYVHCAVTTGGPATIHCCNYDGNGSACVVGAAVASQGVWQHVAWVLSAGTWSLYVNGAKQGDVPSMYQAYPSVSPAGAVARFGVDVADSAGVVGTVDEFRVSYSALYTANFTPPKHLDAAGALNLLLDEGAGTTSGPATLHGNSSWVTVSR